MSGTVMTGNRFNLPPHMWDGRLPAMWESWARERDMMRHVAHCPGVAACELAEAELACSAHVPGISGTALAEAHDSDTGRLLGFALFDAGPGGHLGFHALFAAEGGARAMRTLLCELVWARQAETVTFELPEGDWADESWLHGAFQDMGLLCAGVEPIVREAPIGATWAGNRWAYSRKVQASRFFGGGRVDPYALHLMERNGRR